MIDALREFNVSVFHSLNGFLNISAPLDILILFFAQYAVFVIGLVVILSVIRDANADSTRHFRKNAVRIFLTMGTVFGVTELIRYFYHHPRPFIGLESAHLFTVDTFSFPSGHTIFVFGLASAVYFYDKKLAIVLGLVGILVGISRVVAGVHYPLDIVGGIVLGILSGVVVECVLTRAARNQSKGRAVKKGR